MKCPVCALGGVAAHAEQCPQCSADLVIHRLLEEASRPVTATTSRPQVTISALDQVPSQLAQAPSNHTWPGWLPWLIGGQLALSLLLVGAVTSQVVLIRELQQALRVQMVAAHDTRVSLDERATDISKALAGALQDTLHLYDREREERVALTRRLATPPAPVASAPQATTSAAPVDSPSPPSTAHH